MAITQVDLPGVYGAVQREKTGRLQNQLQQLQLQEGQQAIETRNQLRPLLGQAAQGDPQAISQVMELDPDQGMKFQEHVNSMRAADRETFEYEAPLVARAMQGVKDQEGYNMALNTLGQANVDLDNLPQEYDPAAIEQLVMIGTEAEKLKPTGPMRDAQALGLQPGTPAYGDYIRERTLPKPAQTTNIINAGAEERETKYQEERGKQGAEFYEAIQNNAAAARAEQNATRGMGEFVDRVQTGNLANVRLTVGDWARQAGVPDRWREFVSLPDDQEIGAGEALRNLSSGAMFSALQNFTGAISEGEREYVETIIPGLSTSPEGLKQMSQVRGKMNERQMLKARLADEWEGKHGGIHRRDSQGRSFRSFWDDYVRNNPMFSPEEKDALEDLATKSAPDTNLIDSANIKELNGKRYIKIGDAWYEG